MLFLICRISKVRLKLKVKLAHGEAVPDAVNLKHHQRVSFQTRPSTAAVDNFAATIVDSIEIQ
jgi:hypothetical protein